jgi:Phage integrase family
MRRSSESTIIVFLRMSTSARIASTCSRACSISLGHTLPFPLSFLFGKVSCATSAFLEDFSAVLVKTSESAQPVPLSRLACEVLREWRKEQGSRSPYIFPSPRDASKPIRSVKRAWRTALTKANVPYFPIYNLRHVFCTRLSWVAPDAVVQRAMRHSSPDTKRRYQLGLIHQVREHLERANEKTYQGRDPLHFRDSRVPAEVSQVAEVRN